MVGGTWGLWEGLRHPEGTSTRVRVTSVINGCTRRGPFLANTGAVLGISLIIIFDVISTVLHTKVLIENMILSINRKLMLNFKP